MSNLLATRADPSFEGEPEWDNLKDLLDELKRSD